jgi:hypothetical protein
MELAEISSDDDENLVPVRAGDFPKIKPGMFVSGWEDPDNDDGIEIDSNPHGKLQYKTIHSNL